MEQTGSKSAEHDALLKRIAELEAQNAAAVKRLAMAEAKVKPAVGKSGGVCIVGLGQFPTTLYASQWARVFPMVGTLARFIVDNAEKLSWRDGEDRNAIVAQCDLFAKGLGV